MIDKTDNDALENLKKQYGDQIVDYKHQTWNEAYLGRPPQKAFCTGITRYRKCFKITHIVLKDGKIIPVGSSVGCLIYVLLIIIFIFMCI